VPLLLPSPASLLGGISPPPLFSAQGTPPSLLHVFFVVTAYYSIFFPFFPGWGLVCPWGYADLAQDCLWEYRMPLSSPCGLHLPKPSGRCHLVVMWEPSSVPCSWMLYLSFYLLFGMFSCVCPFSYFHDSNSTLRIHNKPFVSACSEFACCFAVILDLTQ
jgi:hypothetical protein